MAYHIIPEHVNVSSIARVPEGSTSVHPTLLTDPSIVYLDGQPQNINFNLDPTTSEYALFLTLEPDIFAARLDQARARWDYRAMFGWLIQGYDSLLV